MSNSSKSKPNSRRRFEVPIIIKEYNSDSPINAKMYGQKESSILFKTDHPLQPSADIYIHSKYPLSDNTTHEDKEIICRARVSWCRPVSNSSFYEVEARFCKPLIQQLQKQGISYDQLQGLWEQESTDFS
jgi:hypothetical protein